MNKPQYFWITNICNRNVSIADLNLTIKAYTSVNLLDKRHYQYTLEQLEKSASEGSIFSKRDRLSIRKVKPENIIMNIPFVSETVIPTRERSLFNIKEEKYEELNVSDEDFANENAEIAELDRQPIFQKT